MYSYRENGIATCSDLITQLQGDAKRQLDYLLTEIQESERELGKIIPLYDEQVNKEKETTKE